MALAYLLHGFGVVVHPFHGAGFAGRVEAFEADDRQGQLRSGFSHVLMQLCGKGVCGVYQQPDVVLAAEVGQGSGIHAALQPDAVVQGHLLLVAAGGVVEGLSGLFQCFGRCPAFGSSS